MDTTSTLTPPAGNGNARKPYRAPTLTFFGEVRKLTQATNSGSAEGSVGNPPFKTKVSDVSLKENLVRVGVHPLGFGLYLFEYRAPFRDSLGHGRHFGVVAQEVEPVIPRAVSVGRNGFKSVDYEMLGINPAR